jgi:stage II sporulation SpoAA-like protein
MALQIESKPGDVYVLRISGTLKRSEFAASQQDLARKIDKGSKPRVLAIVDNFEGWERGADWNDLDFLVSHAGEIARIAVVADPKWELQALAFAGAGVRKAPVKFFSTAQLSEARSWIAA